MKIFRPAPWKGLKHPPVAIDDLIGQLLISEEGFSGKKAERLHDALLSAARHGIDKMPITDKLRMFYAMKRYNLTYADGEELYGKYVGNWGGTATGWRFDAIRGETVVASVACRPSKKLHLDVRVSSTELSEGDGYDMAAVRVRILDENGTVASYAQLPVRFTVSGALMPVGPDTATAEGGMTGTYVKTDGSVGSGTLTVSCAALAPVTVRFTITNQEL